MKSILRSTARSTVWVCLFGMFVIGCGAASGDYSGGVDGADEDVDSANTALMRLDEDGSAQGSAAPAAAESVAQRAASCTATSDGGKWCCAPDANGTLKCWKVPPPPPPDTIATRSVLTAKALAP